MADDNALIQTMVGAVMRVLDETGACDRTRTFRTRLLGENSWALDYWTLNHPNRRTLLLTITDTPPDSSDPGPGFTE